MNGLSLALDSLFGVLWSLTCLLSKVFVRCFRPTIANVRKRSKKFIRWWKWSSIYLLATRQRWSLIAVHMLLFWTWLTSEMFLFHWKSERLNWNYGKRRSVPWGQRIPSLAWNTTHWRQMTLRRPPVLSWRIVSSLSDQKYGKGKRSIHASQFTTAPPTNSVPESLHCRRCSNSAEIECLSSYYHRGMSIWRTFSLLSASIIVFTELSWASITNVERNQQPKKVLGFPWYSNDTGGWWNIYYIKSNSVYLQKGVRFTFIQIENSGI